MNTLIDNGVYTFYYTATHGVSRFMRNSDKAVTLMQTGSAAVAERDKVVAMSPGEFSEYAFFQEYHA